jgi:peptide/nickel transport system substrate-binding protein
VTYTLDPRAVWSDGVAITCTDFYLAWMAGRGDVDKDGNRIFDSASTLGYADIGAITCSPDGRVVTVRFLRPSGGWPLLFSYLVPAHLVTTNAKVKDLVAADRKADPAVLARLGSAWVSLFAMDKVLPKNALVSGGPFTVTDWKKGARLTLSRNDKWWGDPARLQRVAFVVFTDPAKQLAALKAGQVQVITGPTDPATLGTTPDPNLVVAQGGAAAIEHVVFNLRNPFLQNRAIRRALGRCIPRAAIVQGLAAKGLAATTAPGSYLLTPDQPGYQDESVALTVVDDAQIAADLAKAGWTKGPDGLLENAGKPVTLRVLGDGGPRSAIAVPQIVQACRTIGFDVVVDPVAAERDARIASGDFDLALVSLPMRAEPSQVRTRYEATGVDNIGAYVSSTVTGQFAQLSAATAVADRTRLVVAIDQQLWQDAPSVPLDQPLGRITRRATVDNVVRNPFAPGLGWQLTEWVLH